MSGTIQLDLTSALPPFEQIRTQLASLITTGALPAGSRLPTVRDLAADLGVAVGTVRRAYVELEAAGLIVSRRRTGTVVAADAGIGGRDLHAAIADLVRLARAQGVSDAALLELVRGAQMTR